MQLSIPQDIEQPSYAKLGDKVLGVSRGREGGAVSGGGEGKPRCGKDQIGGRGEVAR